VNGATETGERPLGPYRDYLRVLARLQLSVKARVKVDASDIAQQAILHAHANRGQFCGETEAEWLGWLRAILANTLAAAFREFNTAARDLTRERSLEAELEHSSARLEGLLAADQSSPSEGAARGEELLRLAAALGQLPDDQRRVVELHHLKGLTVAEVAAEIGRTRPAAVGLLFRGLKRLRELLGSNSEGKA
jgi:RNA polymerase sigma-70 factor, ECF subfamily